MKRPLDLWAMRIFAEVATTRSMTRAAERLDLTQSAVSQAVRKLEISLGVPLIDRNKTPISLTMSGSLLDKLARPLLSEAGRIEHQLRDASDIPPHEIRLGLVDSFASTAGPALIRSLTAPKTQVVLWSGLAGSLAEALTSDDVDAIVTSDPLDDHDGLLRLPLWREPFILLLPREMAVPKPLSFSTLAAILPMIRFSARSHSGRQIDRHLRRVGFEAERRLEVDGADAMAAMVAAGIGWAITTPLALLQGESHMANLVALPMPAPAFGRTLTLICRADGPAAIGTLVAHQAVRVLRDSCLPRIALIAPDLVDAINIIDPKIISAPPALQGVYDE